MVRGTEMKRITRVLRSGTVRDSCAVLLGSAGRTVDWAGRNERRISTAVKDVKGIDDSARRKASPVAATYVLGRLAGADRQSAG
jgi:hypothetical protein